jgi:hypothetical protein
VGAGVISAARRRSAAAGAAIVVRGSNVVTGNGLQKQWPLPSGSAAGDLAIVFGGHNWPLAAQSGGASLDSRDGNFWNGETMSMVLTSTHISNGYLELTSPFADEWALGGIVFNGPTGGVRATAFSRNDPGATSRSLTTDSTPRSGDYAIAFGSGRLNADATCDLGSELDEEHAATRFAVLNGGALLSNGAVTANFTYGATPSGDYQGVVVIKGSVTNASFSQNPTLSSDSGFYGEGDTLTVTYAHNGTSETIAWLRDGIAIGGATTATYTLVSADLGTMISARVTATNTAGTAQLTSSAVGPIVTPTYSTEDRVTDTGDQRVTDTADVRVTTTRTA